MKGITEARKDFKANSRNNLIELLNAIKEHSLNFKESRYKMAIIAYALKNFLLCK